jgi:hypothetical protein
LRDAIQNCSIAFPNSGQFVPPEETIFRILLTGTTKTSVAVCGEAAARENLFELGRRLVGLPIIFQCNRAHAAKIEVVPNHSWITRVGPFNFEIPLATIIRGVEFDINTISVWKNAVWRKLIIGPFIVARIIETKKFNAVAGAVHYRDVPLVLGQRPAR